MECSHMRCRCPSDLSIRQSLHSPRSNMWTLEMLMHVSEVYVPVCVFVCVSLGLCLLSVYSLSFPLRAMM